MSGPPFYVDVYMNQPNGVGITVKVQLDPPGHVQAYIANLVSQGWHFNSLGSYYDQTGNVVPPPGGGSQGPGPQGPGPSTNPQTAVTQSQAALAVFAIGAVAALGGSSHRRKRKR